MGGCCCASRKPPLHGSPIYFYYPSEEHESLTSHDSVATALSAGFLIDLNLDRSDPDTFRSPPAPIPFDVVLGRPQSPKTSLEELIHRTSFEKATVVNLTESDCKSQQNFLLASPIDVELSKSNMLRLPKAEEEEVCPTCLEDYDDDNPKIITKCDHHFHLSCILEWTERSHTCPICDQEMIYEDF
ncbi:hypothetical protein LIER_05508 [Lithospermum erythrorhizon]|uniref:RING-type E3 ubiquitin transferase n=1 Tax=Lithospermum erythrorhizon TaxID=34254 RepID=A0AAV3P1P5_LITER